MASSAVESFTFKGAARTERGLPTPEPTPGPDEARNKASKTHQARTQDSAQLPTIKESDPQGPGSTTQPLEISDDESAESVYSSKESETSNVTALEKREAVEQVLACGKSEYRKILGINEQDNDGRVDKENIFNHFRKRGCLLHPDFNRTAGAEKAFKRVLHAAKKLDVGKDEINEVKYWDGEEVLSSLRLTQDGHWAAVDDDMDGVEQSSEPRPSQAHQDIWKQATPLLAKLMHDPKDEAVVAQVDALNSKVVEENHKLDIGDEAFVIDVNTFRAIFTSAGPYLERLRRSHADEEARKHFETLNAQLVNFNKHHQYPSEWVMILPEEVTEVPATTTTTPGTIVKVPGKPAFRRCNNRPNHILDNGIYKKIEGAMRAGFGYHLLLSHPGDNDLSIYELAAASIGGRGFGKSYAERPDAVMIQLGSLEDLTSKQFTEMGINGVASVRRNPADEPARGWVREAKTICSIGFGNDPTAFKWFARSTLGRRYGQKVVDEEIDGFRTAAGQDQPLGAKPNIVKLETDAAINTPIDAKKTTGKTTSRITNGKSATDQTDLEKRFKELQEQLLLLQAQQLTRKTRRN